MIYKTALFGASGRMGLEIAALLRDHYMIGEDALELCDVVVNKSSYSSIEGVPTRTLNEPERDNPHVWIDFSLPEGTMALLKKADGPVFIGTTGFTDAQLEVIKDYATKHPVLLASNTSLGIHLFQQLLKQIKPTSSAPMDVVLEESHHTKKKDLPSGTAHSLLDTLKGQGFKNVQVHAIRAGNIKGIHKVSFVSESETIEIRHEVTDRSVFAKGALYGAYFLLHQKTPRLYTMEEAFLEI